MDIELDEVYIASIKEIFKEFDDEIIWSAIFEHGYTENGGYKLENVINYLLELSENKVYETIKIPKSNIINNKDRENNQVLEDDIGYNINEENTDNNNFLSTFIKSVTAKDGYQKLENSE